MKKINCKEGDWFAVPLRNGGFGVGLVARKGRGGRLFGYFFGPRHEELPTLDQVRGLRAEDAVFCERFGDLGIRSGEWPVLGRLGPWVRADWPMPEFGRIDNIIGIAWIVRYDEDNPVAPGEARRATVEEARGLPPDGLSGYGAIEILLTEKLPA